MNIKLIALGVTTFLALSSAFADTDTNSSLGNSNSAVSGTPDTQMQGSVSGQDANGQNQGATIDSSGQVSPSDNSVSPAPPPSTGDMNSGTVNPPGAMNGDMPAGNGSMNPGTTNGAAGTNSGVGGAGAAGTVNGAAGMGTR